MEYKILDKDNMQEYLYSIDTIKEYFSEEELEIDEIGNGNLNYVFIIKSKSGEQKPLILKQAVPYLRCLGEDFALSKDRMNYEIRALNSFHNSSSDYVPKIYEANEEMSTLIMQYLGEHKIMREFLIDEEMSSNFSEQISTYLANNLFLTSSLNLDSTSKRELIDKFNSNSELCKLTEDYVFTFAFMEHPANDAYSKDHTEFEKLISNMEFKKQVLALKYKFMTKNDALLHGDLHTGSIMLNENETYVIDPEFAFVGPFGFDIGALLGNLVMSYVSHTVQGHDEKYTKWILQTIKEMLDKFEQKFLELWNNKNESALVFEGFIDDKYLDEFKKEFIKDILRDSAGYAGCKMARRMFGTAGVEDIRGIENLAIRDKAIEMVLNIATNFVINHKDLDTVEKIINVINDNY